LPELLAPSVEGLAADSMLPGHLRDTPPVGLPQDLDHLLFGETALPHGSLACQQGASSQESNGPKIAGQVTIATQASRPWRPESIKTASGEAGAIQRVNCRIIVKQTKKLWRSDLINVVSDLLGRFITGVTN
jgi:hypothetical protein